jgi:hypothetical protein
LLIAIRITTETNTASYLRKELRIRTDTPWT